MESDPLGYGSKWEAVNAMLNQEKPDLTGLSGEAVTHEQQQTLLIIWSH